MNRKLLTKAAEQGLISEQQAASLLEFIARQQAEEALADNSGEQLRFMRSFGDIFISLGILLLAFTTNQLLVSPGHYLATIAGLVLLAEWLVGGKRLVLPGITLLLCILYFVNKAADGSVDGFESSDVFLMSLSSLLFYVRYRMPFSLYPMAVGIIYLSIKLSGIDIVQHSYVFILFGVAVFGVAMWYDSRDTTRSTSLSDNAFWLHLLAAPLIVHGVMVSLLLSEHGAFPSNSVYILLLFTLFFFVALFVDRRAILVSSFAYALYAVFKFAYQQFMQVDNLTLFVFMGVGIFIIFFGTYWYRVRRWVYSPISSFRICKLVPAFAAD